MSDLVMRAFDNIKPFYGTAQDNSRDWCDRVEIIFNAFNVNDADRLSRIGIKLEDAAFNWYRTSHGLFATWPEFRQKLLQAFPPPERTQNRHLLAEQINQRKQGPDESVHDYYYGLDKLCRDYDPQMSAIDKTIKLVSGLRDELKEKLLPWNVQTPEEFLDKAKNFESSERVMACLRKSTKTFELPEPIYSYESNDYTTVAASQPVQIAQPLCCPQINQLPYSQRPDSRQHPIQVLCSHGNADEPYGRCYRRSEPVQRIIQQRSVLHEAPQSEIRSTTQQERPCMQSAPRRHYHEVPGRNRHRANRGDRRVECYNCGGFGHKQNQCSRHLN